MGHCQSCACHVGHCLDEQRGIVQRLCPPQLHPVRFREFLECDVNIVEHFHVITDEPDWLDEHTLVLVLLKVNNNVFHGWTEPRTTAHTLALEGERPVVLAQSSFMCDQGRSVLCLRCVWIP